MPTAIRRPGIAPSDILAEVQTLKREVAQARRNVEDAKKDARARHRYQLVKDLSDAQNRLTDDLRKLDRQERDMLLALDPEEIIARLQAATEIARREQENLKRVESALHSLSQIISLVERVIRLVNPA